MMHIRRLGILGVLVGFLGSPPALHATDVTGTVANLGEVDTLVPGDHAEVALELTKPVGMEPGTRFAVREGGKTVGAGVVVSVE